MSKGISIKEVQKTEHAQHVAARRQKWGAALQRILNSEIQWTRARVSGKDKERFYKELASLLDAGLDIKSALELSIKVLGGSAQELLQGMPDSLIAGNALSVVMKETGQFSEYECKSVQIGEEAAVLPSVLESLGAYFDQLITQRRELISALSYPFLVLIAAFGAVFFMLSYVVPMFESVFLRFGEELPALTRWILYLSSAMGTWLSIGVLVMMGLTLLYLLNKERWNKHLSNFVLIVPGVGSFVRQIYLARFANMMHLCLEAKLSVLEAVQYAQGVIGFWPLKRALAQVEEQLRKGDGIHVALSLHTIFPEKMITLVGAGMEVNLLGRTFLKLATSYSAENKHKITVINRILEPLLILVVGGLVAVILIAMYLPIFNMGGAIGG